MAKEDVELEEQSGELEEEKESSPKGKAGLLQKIKSKLSGRKRIVIGVGVAGLFGTIAFFAMTGGEAATEPGDEGAAASPQDDGASASDLFQNGGVLGLETLLVNLATAGKGNDFLRVRISLVFASLEEMEKVQDSDVATAKIRDLTLGLLSSKHASEIGSLEGRAELRKELALELEGILGGIKIADVLFTDFIIQH